MTEVEKIKQHWNQEARRDISDYDKLFPLGYAGTYNDVKLQHLEMQAIAKYLKKEDRVLDVGCGKGYAALYMALDRGVKLLGVDYAEEMIAEARRNLDELSKKVPTTINADFVVGDVMNLNMDEDFDVVYTERCLINLSTWENQQKAIQEISKALKKGGLFVMQEASMTSLNKLNQIRAGFGLEPIKPVWHNLFFEDNKLIQYASEFFDLEKIDDFASTYTLISRVLNPALVAPDEPNYDNKINKLSLKLPNQGDYGYQKIYVFRKK